MIRRALKNITNDINYNKFYGIKKKNIFLDRMLNNIFFENTKGRLNFIGEEKYFYEKVDSVIFQRDVGMVKFFYDKILFVFDDNELLGREIENPVTPKDFFNAFLYQYFLDVNFGKHLEVIDAFGGDKKVLGFRIKEYLKSVISKYLDTDEFIELAEKVYDLKEYPEYIKLVEQIKTYMYIIDSRYSKFSDVLLYGEKEVDFESTIEDKLYTYRLIDEKIEFNKVFPEFPFGDFIITYLELNKDINERNAIIQDILNIDGLESIENPENALSHLIEEKNILAYRNREVGLSSIADRFDEEGNIIYGIIGIDFVINRISFFNDDTKVNQEAFFNQFNSELTHDYVIPGGMGEVLNIAPYIPLFNKLFDFYQKKT